jgi:DNA-binding transcriptional LysR family regulator
MPLLGWDDVRFFLAVVRHGGLSSAARALAVEHSTVSRRVAALEARIGVRLFDRLPHRWTLTGEGAVLLGPAERMEQEAFAFGRAATGAGKVRAVVRVTAPPAFASHFLVPQLAARAAQWPDAEIEVVSEVRMANLHRQEADLSLRFSRPEELGLIARRLGTLAFRLYATAAWLSRPEADWHFLGYGGALREVPHQRMLADLAGPRPFVLRSNDLLAVHRACRAGLGLAMLPRFVAGEDRELIEVPKVAPAVTREIWLIVHPDVRRSARVRRLADLITELVQSSASILN